MMATYHIAAKAVKSNRDLLRRKEIARRHRTILLESIDGTVIRFVSGRHL
jgi:hypothetical protein